MNTKSEKAIANKTYYEKNKVAIEVKRKIRYEKNREAILNRMKEYRAANREEINKKQRGAYNTPE